MFVIYLNILYNIINGKVLKDVIYDRIIQELELTDEGFKDRFTNAEIFFYKLAFNELRPPYIDVEISISDETRLTILGILREGVIHVFTLPSYTINHMYFFDSGVKKFKIENDLSKNRIEKITVITKSGSFVVYDEKKETSAAAAGPKEDKKRSKKKKKKGGNKKNTKKKSYKKDKTYKKLIDMKIKGKKLSKYQERKLKKTLGKKYCKCIKTLSYGKKIQVLTVFVENLFTKIEDLMFLILIVGRKNNLKILKYS